MEMSVGRSGITLISVSLLTACSCLFAQQEKRLSFGEQKVFKASRADSPMTIDGKLDEEAWQKTESRTLDYFYRVEKPTDQQKTLFHMHFGFELNLYKASNDFIHLSNFYQGKRGSVYSYDPDFEVEVTVDGTINDNSDLDKGWTMELAIPLKLFRGTDRYSKVKAGNQWAFLAIRQERNEVEGRRRITSTIFPIYDIEKDVHQPGRFGLLEFIE